MPQCPTQGPYSRRSASAGCSSAATTPITSGCRWWREGSLAVATQVARDATDRALAEIYREIERLRTEPVAEEELSLVRNMMTGEMMRILDGPFGIADVTIENILCGWDHTVIGENIRRIQAMTPADIQRLAQKYLAREDLVTVIAGDPIPEERQAPEEKADRQ